jgi:signal transduction histidine kinase
MSRALAGQSGLTTALASEVTVSGTAVVSGVAAVVAGGTAVWSLRVLAVGPDRVQRDLLEPFAAVAAVVAVGAVAVPVAAERLRAGLFSVLPLVTFLVAFVPWNVFAFRYAGRGTLLTRRRTLAVSSLVAVLLGLYVAVAAGVFDPSRELYSTVLLGASTLLLALVALTFVSAGLVLTESYRHGSIPLASGVVVVLPVVVLVVGIQVVSLSDVLTRELLAALHLVGAAAALPVAVVRYDVLATRPGATTLGERTVIQDLDEAVLVGDRDGRVILSNRRAERLFGPDLDGRPIESVVGADLDHLRESSILECRTASEYKRFDPRVSPVTGSHDRTIGRAVTLIDVTDRTMLRQRVQVLNRVFRHNIRNDIDVIRSHAEFALETGPETDPELGESIERILGVTDDIEQLSADARRIERLARRSSADRQAVDLRRLVETVVESAVQHGPDVSVTVDVPSIELSVSRDHLRFALRNLVDNAVEHSDGSPPRVEIRAAGRPAEIRIVVADDGPGIPDAEWQVIEAGREEALNHLTSLGLWGTKWAVQRMGGELSRRDDEPGAAVVITLPRPTDPAPASTRGV